MYIYLKKNFLKTSISCSITLLFVVVLQQLNFQPIQYLIHLDQTYLSPLSLHFPESRRRVTPVVFVDVDEYSLRKFGNHIKGQSTPRSFQSELINAVNSLGAKVIVLDFDYIDPADDDELLRTAILQSNAYIIFPRYFNKLSSIKCDRPNENDIESIELIPSILDDIVDNQRIFSGHANYINSFDTTIGYCSSMNAINPYSHNTEVVIAIPVLVNEIIGNKNMGDVVESTISPGELIQHYYFQNIQTKNINKKFYRIIAQAVLDKSTEVDKSMFNGSIVVIGGSHSGSRDMHNTASGEISGSALLAMSSLLFQNGLLKNVGIFLGTMIDLLIIVIQSLILPLLSFPLEKLYVHHSAWLAQKENRTKLIFHKFGYHITKCIIYICIPLILLILIHKYIIFTFLNFNTYTVILPLFVPALELFFSYNQKLADKCSFLLTTS